MLYNLFNAVSTLLNLLSTAIFAYCILTWIAPRSPLCYWLERFISPICAPFRSLARMMIVRWGAPFDFTCWFAIIGLRIIRSLLQRIFYLLIL